MPGRGPLVGVSGIVGRLLLRRQEVGNVDDRELVTHLAARVHDPEPLGPDQRLRSQSQERPDAVLQACPPVRRSSTLMPVRRWNSLAICCAAATGVDVYQVSAPSRLAEPWAGEDSNLRPADYESAALTD